MIPRFRTLEGDYRVLNPADRKSDKNLFRGGGGEGVVTGLGKFPKKRFLGASL